MGELVQLFPVLDNLRYLPGHTELAPHPEMCGHSEVPDIPIDVIRALDKLLDRKRITEEQAVDALDHYFETGELQMSDEPQPASVIIDPNQLTLF